MIICVICQHKNLDGMMFCENCGTQIAGLPLDTYAIKPDPIKSTMNISSEGVHKPGGLETWASLHLIETGHILPLGDKSEFTLGRVSDNQAIMPDIDLTPYQAFANGVSRIHAVIKRNDKRVSVMDLGSSNGTYMNNERITPNVKIQILLNF